MEKYVSQMKYVIWIKKVNPNDTVIVCNNIQSLNLYCGNIY